MRVAAIDIGSNSIHLMVAEGDGANPGDYRVLDDEKIVTRLSRGLEPDGLLKEEKIREAAESVHRLAGIARGYDVDLIRAIATAAVRSADNGHAVVDLVRAVDGLDVEVIDAEREAALAFRSVDRAFDLTGQRVAVVDVGGGSTEVVLATDGVVEQVMPLPIGAVRLTDLYGASEDDAGLEHAALRAAVRDAVRDGIEKPDMAPSMLIGVGGTFTALAGMSLANRSGAGFGETNDRPVGGHELMHEELRHLLDWLRKLPVEERALTPGLNPERADIIVAGLEIIDRVVRRLGVNRIRVHDKGVRDGLVLEMLEERSGADSAGGGAAGGTGGGRARLSRVDSARRFAEKCRYEAAHSGHVAVLSLSIFDALAAAEPGTWCEGAARELLEAAALLHNIGYLVSYQKHHKHSYHLIVHSGMPGFTRRELELVAQIARYHRRAKPSEEHKPFAALDLADQDLVCKLAGILRIADGLNRTHRQTVASVRVEVEPGRSPNGVPVPGRVLILARGDDDGMGVWGAERKKRLFERAFGAAVSFAAEPEPDPEAGAEEGPGARAGAV